LVFRAFAVALAPIAPLAFAALAGCSADAGSTDAPPLTPAPPASAPACAVEAASAEEVSVNNDFGALSGTLSVPERCGSVPVILILSGTGQTDRNANGRNGTYKTDAYRMLSEALVAQAGVAVLRYDDHGIGKSTRALPPDRQSFTFGLETDDALRFVRKLRQDRRFSRVMLAGHSLGSLMGTVMATREPIDGLISLEGPGRRPCAIFHDQVVAQGAKGTDLAEFDKACATLERGELPGPLGTGLAGQVFPEALQTYFASYIKYDPAAEIARVTAPALVVHGKTDEDVDLADAELLHAKKPDSELVEIESMAHMLKRATSSVPSQDAARSDPTVPLAEGLVPALRAFIDAHR
jgi:pimeloyl-ACP methyl ester carboxylesterase